MPDEFQSAKAYAKELEQANGMRTQLDDAMEGMYWMDWAEEDAVTKQMKNIKVTRSPRARNAIIGAKRLLIATDPIVSVPFNINGTLAKDKSELIEKFATAELFASGRLAGNPIHYDAVLSSLLYGRVAIGINSTKEMLAQASAKAPAVRTRLEEIAKRTPYLFEILNPKTCYVERDIMGITAFYRKVQTTVGAIKDNWGKDGEKALRSNVNKNDFSRDHAVVLNDFYDLRNRFLWMDGYEKPIKAEPHGLPFIPVAYAITEGSQLFDTPEKQSEPFLYTAYKSGVIDRENLILTTIYTMLFSMGANPMFIEKLIDPDSPPVVDYSIPGGTIRYRINEDREVMSKQIIDPAMMQAWDIANELEMQSTLYRQALGEPVSSSTPYSSYALMSQSGRLPLIATQKMVSHAIGEAIEISLKWMKNAGKTNTAQYRDIAVELTPEQIPDVIDIDVSLEIALPIDQLQMANAANMLAQGDNPMVSQRWARENVLHIGQSKEMDKEIWDEKGGNIYVRKYFMQKLAELAQLEQMAMQPQNSMASGMPGGMPMPATQPGGAAPSNPQNFGTPELPATPPGPPPVPPREPLTPLAPNLQPLNPPR